MEKHDRASTGASPNISARVDGRHTSGYVSVECDEFCHSYIQFDVTGVGERDEEADVLRVGILTYVICFRNVSLFLRSEAFSTS